MNYSKACIDGWNTGWVEYTSVSTSVLTGTGEDQDFFGKKNAISPFFDAKISVLLSASVKSFSVSHMRDFLFINSDYVLN